MTPLQLTSQDQVSRVEQTLEEGGVRYFGAMAASISHEIKNCLAIMNENTGLMGDLIALGRQRPPLDTERIETISHRINAQIQRADTILKNLNLFSHSVDKAVQAVDLSQAIELALVLGSRICSNKRISIRHRPGEQRVQTTAPFFYVLCLIWTAVEGAMEALAPESSLEISASKKDGRPVVSLSADQPIGSGIEAVFTSPGRQNLLTIISAEVDIDTGNQQANLIFPLSCPAGV